MKIFVWQTATVTCAYLAMVWAYKEVEVYLIKKRDGGLKKIHKGKRCYTWDKCVAPIDSSCAVLSECSDGRGRSYAHATAWNRDSISLRGFEWLQPWIRCCDKDSVDDIGCPNPCDAYR